MTMQQRMEQNPEKLSRNDSLQSEVLKTTSWHEPPKSWLIKIRSWNHELEKSGFQIGNRLLYNPTKFS